MIKAIEVEGKGTVLVKAFIDNGTKLNLKTGKTENVIEPVEISDDLERKIKLDVYCFFRGWIKSGLIVDPMFSKTINWEIV